MKTRHIIPGIFLALFSLYFLQACSIEDDITPEPVVGPAIGKLQTGSKQQLGNFTVSPGNKKTIGSTGLELGLDGMQISQELSSSSTLSISAAPIEGHTFGSLINPISPLITIHVSNEADELETLYKVSIPISEAVGEDEFMMAFYYDAASGKLEGIPTVAYESNRLTITTTHFSDFFITKVKLALLPDKIYTGFRPEVDGWPYTNYGTYYNPNGICAGMSLTAMHIYANHGGNLFTKADNDMHPESPTPNFGFDDVHGIVFGDFGQDIYVNMLKVWQSNVWLLGLDDAITYRCFAYSMSVTAEPQYVRLGGSTFTGGHAMVAYAIDEKQIFVYDPNYPARRDRIVNFRGGTSGRFDPYNSGDNAESIANGYGRSYDLITYASKSALISTKELEEGYAEYIANNLYEKYYAINDLELVLKNEKGTTVARSKVPEFVCSEKVVDLKYGNQLSGIDENAIFYNHKFEAITGDVTLDENNATIIGVYNVGKKSGSSRWSWLGFKWFSVKYSKLDPNLFGTWAVSSGGDYYAWTFQADGKAIQEIAGQKYNWLWVIEEGRIKLFLENGKPAYYTYKIENNELYLWIESVGTWGVPFTKTG